MNNEDSLKFESLKLLFKNSLRARDILLEDLNQRVGVLEDKFKGPRLKSDKL